jgi:hypothetical protein
MSQKQGQAGVGRTIQSCHSGEQVPWQLQCLISRRDSRPDVSCGGPEDSSGVCLRRGNCDQQEDVPDNSLRRALLGGLNAPPYDDLEPDIRISLPTGTKRSVRPDSCKISQSADQV